MLNSAAGTEQCSTRVHVEMGGWRAAQRAEPGGADGSRLSVSQQRPLLVKGVNVFWGIHCTQLSQPDKREISLIIFNVGGASPEILCAVLGSVIFKPHEGALRGRHQRWWQGWKGCPVRRGWGHFSQFGKEEAERWPQCSLQLSKEGKKREALGSASGNRWRLGNSITLSVVKHWNSPPFLGRWLMPYACLCWRDVDNALNVL